MADDDTTIKGPDPEHWGPEARAERGAELVEEENPLSPEYGDDGEAVKGPDAAVWGG